METIWGLTFDSWNEKCPSNMMVSLHVAVADHSGYVWSQDNWTALLNAAKEGHTEVVHMLCERGAYIEHIDMVSKTRVPIINRTLLGQIK